MLSIIDLMKATRHSARVSTTPYKLESDYPWVQHYEVITAWDTPVHSRTFIPEINNNQLKRQKSSKKKT